MSSNNGQSNMYNYIKIIVQRKRIGAPLSTQTAIETFSPHPYNESSYILILDGVYVLLIFYSAYCEILEFLPSLWRRGLIGGLKKYLNIWNGVDWFNIGMSSYIMYFYYGVVMNV